MQLVVGGWRRRFLGLRGIMGGCSWRRDVTRRWEMGRRSQKQWRALGASNTYNDIYLFAFKGWQFIKLLRHGQHPMRRLTMCDKRSL